ncbi:MAG: ABC transporter permease [Ktedonobacteraceae bacterium]
MFLAFCRSSWVICLKDIRVWLRHPSHALFSFLPAVTLLLLTSLGAAAVGHNPVALVVQDHGSYGQKFAQIFHQAGIFRIYDVDAQQAQQLYNNVDIAAIITVPPDFTQRVLAHEHAPIEMTVNNLNLDFTSDVRRSVPDIITQFYASEGLNSPIQVGLQEHNLRAQDIEIFQYTVLPAIIFLLTISGLVNGGLATAREWETRTIKELLLSPTNRSAIVVGKVLASFLITLTLGVFVLLVCTLLGWLHPQGIYWLTALLIIALTSLFSASLGIAIGSATRRIQPVGSLSINVGMYLFFLAGGIGVLAFEPQILQQIASFIPLTYGMHALQMATFYNSSEYLGQDTLVLCVSILVALVLGVVSTRRGMTN